MLINTSNISLIKAKTQNFLGPSSGPHTPGRLMPRLWLATDAVSTIQIFLDPWVGPIPNRQWLCLWHPGYVLKQNGLLFLGPQKKI